MRLQIAALCLLVALPAIAKPKTTVKIVQASASQEEVRAREALRRTQDLMACLDEQNRFQTEVQRRAAACDLKAIEHRQCVARVRDRQSSNTGKGALIGLGAAVLTGGASLLFTGAGALIGHQTSDEAPNECGSVPNCDGAFIAATVTRETGLQRRDCQPPERTK